MRCNHCNTQLLPEERDERISGGNFHYFCAIRMIVGSVGHQLRSCPCYRRFDDKAFRDPPNMSKREAAIAAYFLNQGRQLPSVVAGIHDQNCNC